MPSKEKKILTPEEKFKLELQTETELLRQQRQFHILERDRKTFGSCGALGKQKKVISILKKEYNEILTDLGVAASEANAKQDAKIAENLQTLLAEHNGFVSDIKREKAYLDELDMQITMAKKTIIELRSQSMTEIQSTQKIMEGQRTLEALENKLECATKRFCMTLTENRKLREDIDHLLKERTHFNKLWDKLITNLSQGKKFMLDLIEQATLAYDQREEWCQKLGALRTRALGEYQVHTQEMTEMQRQIDHETKLEQFLTVKGQKRIMKMLLQNEQKKREEMRKEMEEVKKKYTEMLDNIKEFMGEESMMKVAEKYSETEADNFSKFQYICAMNKELETLSDELHSLQLTIDEQKTLRELRATQQTKRIEQLEVELQSTTQEADEAEKSLAATEKTVSELINGIDDLFKLCKCSNAPLLELLGQNTKINIHNVLLYLEILEKKINEMMMCVYYKEKKTGARAGGKGTGKIIKDEKVKHHNVLIEEMVSKDPCPLCVEQTLVSDVIDSLQKVMDRDQIRERLAEAIEKRGFGEVVHNVSHCHLPKSRAIIQRRYQ